MKIKKIDNELLKYRLQDRDEVLENALYVLDPDDEQLREYKRFLREYNKLEQWEKDLFYLSTQMKMTALSNLYAVDRTTLWRYLTKIREKLCLKN